MYVYVFVFHRSCIWCICACIFKIFYQIHADTSRYAPKVGCISGCISLYFEPAYIHICTSFWGAYLHVCACILNLHTCTYAQSKVCISVCICLYLFVQALALLSLHRTVAALARSPLGLRMRRQIADFIRIMFNMFSCSSRPLDMIASVGGNRLALLRAEV